MIERKRGVVNPASLDEIHSFWFGDLSGFDTFPEDKFPVWFVQNDDTDATIRKRFGKLIQEAVERDWRLDLLTPSQQLGLVILLDQFRRNVYRGTPAAYADDATARKWALQIVGRGFDRFKLIERIFVILPFGHSEDIADQDLAVALAEQHYFPFAAADHFFTAACRRQCALYRDIVVRFGRFPHRNAILGRETTPEEAQFISDTNLSPM
jgi:uncharacterized protein (DUF924 family)